ncbi:helix-turn-helix transcriptional regulator [Conexibacter arvalis]|uniref:DNA-binding PadR family transcriptional regulator n=1 Tax=Conexibacter arvalis TaxID=912552 RepID=A0A840IIG0_9ACTN|nr:DNA-binding PadR family transcriptional regulator [Conexibacter arvalis]
MNFAVLGLVIERPSYGYELSKRLQSRFGELLEVRSPSHVYAALDRLQGEGLVEGMPAEVRTAEGPSRQPKVHYRATAAGAFAYRQWLAERLRDDEERVELLGKLIAVGARDPEALGDMLDRYDAECVAATQRMPLADRAAAGVEPPAEFVRRLVAEERRFVLEAQLRWIDYAREELRARAERQRAGGFGG